MSHHAPAQADGYTLAEMIVVLALLALALSLTLPADMRGRSSHSLERQATTIVAMLKAARIGAISKNVETSFEADLENRKLWTTGASEQLQLSDDIGLSMLTARQEAQSGTGVIRFFPDGTSTGGALKLERSKRSIAVSVDWLTGRISRDDAN